MVEDIAVQLNEEHQRVHELMTTLMEARERYLEDCEEGAWLAAARLLAEFTDHMDRHFSFEEHEGFMIHVTRRLPALAPRVEELRREHEALRNDFQDLLAVCERSHSVSTRMQLLGAQLEAILDRLHDHERAENQIVQEATLPEPRRNG